MKTMQKESWKSFQSGLTDSDSPSTQRKPNYSHSKSRPRKKKSARERIHSIFLDSPTTGGYWVIKRKTSKKKMRKSIVAMREWCRNNRHKPLKWQCQMLSSKLRGHFQYFGVRCNMRSMEAVRHFVIRGWQYWLSRRSHKSAISWEQFKQLLEAFPLPTPKIVHNV